MTKYQQIADIIKEAIKEKRISKAKFAKQMGVQPSVVSRWTRGSHNFTIETIFKIEQVLGITIIDCRKVESRIISRIKVDQQGQILA